MSGLAEVPAAAWALISAVMVGGPIAWITHWLGKRASREESLSERAERLTSATLIRQDAELRELRARLDAFEDRFEMLKEHAAALAAISGQLIELVRHARDRVQPQPPEGWPPIPAIPKPLERRPTTQ